MAEAQIASGRSLSELDFCEPTCVYKDLTSLHEILNYFAPIGRTFLLKIDSGGWFPPHRDHVLISRKVFRIVVFLSAQTAREAFEWENDGVVQSINPGKAYYVATQKTHRTHAWRDGSIHLIMNVPKTWENVLKLLSRLEHY